MSFNYYDLVIICETISDQIDKVFSILIFSLLLKVAFTCLRGYKV